MHSCTSYGFEQKHHGYGRDLNNRVATYENSFTPDQAHPHIHIIWRRAGGGHYESVTEQQQSLPFFPRNDPIGNKDNSRTKPWQKVSQFSRPVQMENIVTNTHSSIPPMHTYARQSISISPHSDSSMKLGKHVCPVCRISFKRTVNLKNHVSKIHAGQGLAENPNSKQQACMISTCSLKFRTVDKLIEHGINVHKAGINIEHLTFGQSSLFSEFLKREEIVTNTSVGQAGIGQMSWMRIPPSMLGKRITITRNGRSEQDVTIHYKQNYSMIQLRYLKFVLYRQRVPETLLGQRPTTTPCYSTPFIRSQKCIDAG